MTPSSFAALGCRAPYLSALSGRGFEAPTAVQSAAIPPALEGRDLLVQSRTGSGKTLAFGLPILQRLDPRRGLQALILAPTRELAQQVAAEFRSLDAKLDIALLVGGLGYVPQLRALKNGAPVAVGTPGRVIDHLERGTLDLSGLRAVVLDEADEMLNMGFIEDIQKILGAVREHPQTFLFSATLPGPIAGLAKKFLSDPCQVRLDEPGAAAHADIAHTPCRVARGHRTQALVNLLLHETPSSALVFTATKQESESVAQALRNAGLQADHLNGDLNQGARNRILAQFKEGRLPILVATDVAARGLDVEGLPLVVHLGIPTQMEGYIHRSGRTGRAGAKGTSVAIVDPKEARILQAWSRRGGLTLAWRTVPTPAMIREARLGALAGGLSPVASGWSRAAAAGLLEHHPAESLVAALLEHVLGKGQEGAFVPEAPEERRPASSRFPGGKRADAPQGSRRWEGGPPAAKGSRKPWQAKPQSPSSAPGHHRPLGRPLPKRKQVA
ncbi:MAG: DEAD/DEAH box helicase [Acidobacteria bacterium]|nr:DEAD/DEAH box helicase [Acidobacteriota bacterium]